MLRKMEEVAQTHIGRGRREEHSYNPSTFSVSVSHFDALSKIHC